MDFDLYFIMNLRKMCFIELWFTEIPHVVSARIFGSLSISMLGRWGDWFRAWYFSWWDLNVIFSCISGLKFIKLMISFLLIYLRLFKSSLAKEIWNNLFGFNQNWYLCRYVMIIYESYRIFIKDNLLDL